MARSFTGGNYVEFPAAINVGDAYSFWMKTSTTTANQEIMGRHSATSSNGGWNLSITSTGKLGLSIKPAGGGFTLGITGTKTITDGLWHHVGINIRFTFGACAVYVDGVLDSSGTNGALSGGANAVMRIGRSNDAFWASYVGEIAEFASWGTAGNGAEQLRAEDFEALSKGWNPRRVRKRAMWALCPMDEATVRGYCGALDVPTVSGTTRTDHIRRVF